MLFSFFFLISFFFAHSCISPTYGLLTSKIVINVNFEFRQWLEICHNGTIKRFSALLLVWFCYFRKLPGHFIQFSGSGSGRIRMICYPVPKPKYLRYTVKQGLDGEIVGEGQNILDPDPNLKLWKDGFGFEKNKFRIHSTDCIIQ